MTSEQTDLQPLLASIASGDRQAALALLDFDPRLAQAMVGKGQEDFLTPITRQLYAGDTALHVAAAAHDLDLAGRLIATGARVEARNRRGATPLHYAAVGAPDASWWNPQAQAAVITALIAAGADPDSGDKLGVTPLHRAVRTRSAAAVQALLEGGAEVGRRNGAGSTPLHLAALTTGRGGSGSAAAKVQQALIVEILEGWTQER